MKPEFAAPHRWLGLAFAVALGAFLLAGLLLGLAPRAAAAGLDEPATVYPCSEAGLNSAVAAGGSAVFNCSVPVTVTSLKTVSHDLTLDGSHTLVLTGNGASGVFSVA